MSIVEILDGAGIDSFNMESWITECLKFREWYCKAGTQEIDELAMARAYLKIQHRIKVRHES